jgi:3' terminal RNA ribose 2'-O-methyltransferase Hen1
VVRHWIGRDEVDELMNRGCDWLGSHPQRDLIISRYLKGLRTFTSEALERLTEEESADGAPNAEEQSGEEVLERSLGLGARWVQAVIAQFKRAGAKRVLDMGGGEGRLLRSLLEDPTVEEIVGMDVSLRALHRARERLRLDRMPEAWRARPRLMHSSLTYRDSRLTGFDAAAVIEVVEHLDPCRLAAFERSLFEFARPTLVVVTTPNAEYNVRWPSLPAGELRHEDHRFEWTRGEFQTWAAAAGRRFGYGVRFQGVGADDPEVGSPTQLAVFSR